MPKGGARTGAGRKPIGLTAIRPRRKPEIVALQSIEGGRIDDGVSSVPPEDLSSTEKAFWQRNAGRAIAQGTLTSRTAEAFRLLCELDEERRAVKATIDRDGRTFIKVTVDGAGQEHQELKAHPLKGDYSRLSKQVENLMARFKLAPFGKAEATIKSKTVQANPWGAVAPQVGTK